jgi:serine/threonine-protein kinase
MSQDESESLDFGSLLRRHRTAATLTQEELADRASVSVRAVSDLERGIITRPRPFTVRQLVEALDLSPEDRAEFTQAAFSAITSEDPEAALPRGNFLGSLPVGTLVAREKEMDRLRAALEAAMEGSGGFVLLDGERGTGSTRLLQQTMIEAIRCRCLVLTGHSYGIEREPAYSPLMMAFSRLCALLPADRRGEAQRQWRRIQQRVAAGPQTVHENGLSEAFAELTLLAAQAAPLVLLLDGLHWFDACTLAVLHRIAQSITRSRVLVVGTFCDLDIADKHPNFTTTLLTLSRERLIERITLRRLSLEETAELVAALMEQGGASDEFAAFVYRRTKGNPLFISEMVRSLGGRLQLQAEIGAGSMGRVFRALDRETDTVVAAKLVLARAGIDLDALLHFQREAAVLASLDHPNIVRIRDTFVEEHAACIIMELLDGTSLGRTLQSGPLSMSRAKEVSLQTIQAISYAHSQSIVHRDIKPDNVMILGTGDVKVTDFGIARILQPDTSLGTIATTGMRTGTPLYMAPEQIEGGKIDARTDVYALGALMYHMVTGRPPFEGDDALSVAVKHLKETPIRPSKVSQDAPADWDALILKALSKAPSDRFQSADDMGQAVASLAADNRQTPRATDRKWRLPLAGVAATFAILLLAGFWLHASTSPARASLSSQLRSYFSNQSANHGLSGTALVAQHGKVLLDQGYGFANRTAGILNRADSKYGIAGVTPVLSSTEILMAASSNLLRLSDPVCKFLPTKCPLSWKPISVQMLLDGTSNIPGGLGWGTPGNSVTQTLINCEDMPLDARPGSTMDYLGYTDCDQIVMGFILQAVGHTPWNQTGLFSFPGMRGSGQLTDAFMQTARSVDYQAGVPGPSVTYNDFFAAYSTASDVYAFDNDLFGGKLLSKRDMTRVFTPRAPLAWPDRYVSNTKWGYMWRIASLFGKPVVYTLDGLNDFQTVNMRFPHDGLTVIILSNNLSTDLWDTAVRAAAVVFHIRLTQPQPLVNNPKQLWGTFHRVLLNSDRIAAHDPGIDGWVGQTETLHLGKLVAHTGAADEYYQATRGGLMTFLGYPPTTPSGYCSSLPSETPPTGYYHWSLHGKTLIIRRTRFDTCPDRATIMPGTWTRTS